MQIQNSPSAVWKTGVRSLTNIGALTNTSILNGSIAGAATVELRTSAGNVADMTMAVETGGAATAGIIVQQNDGTNIIQMGGTAPSPNSTFGINMWSTPTCGPRLGNNDATHAGIYSVTSLNWAL